MGKINAGGATGGSTSGQEEHSDWVGTMMKLPQANGGVETKVTTHMPGNNEEGIEGGIDNRGIEQGNSKGDFRKAKFHDGHRNEGGTHRQY